VIIDIMGQKCGRLTQLSRRLRHYSCSARSAAARRSSGGPFAALPITRLYGARPRTETSAACPAHQRFKRRRMLGSGNPQKWRCMLVGEGKYGVTTNRTETGNGTLCQALRVIARRNDWNPTTHSLKASGQCTTHEGRIGDRT
jgi:hypothetical protein